MVIGMPGFASTAQSPCADELRRSLRSACRHFYLSRSARLFFLLRNSNFRKRVCAVPHRYDSIFEGAAWYNGLKGAC